jgi:hypothetical protein
LSAPLKSIQRKSVQEQGGRTLASLHIRNVAEAGFQKPAGGIKGSGVKGFDRGYSGAGKDMTRRQGCGDQQTQTGQGEGTAVHGRAHSSDGQATSNAKQGACPQ